MNVIVKACLLLCSVAYPFLVYWGLGHDLHAWLLMLLAGLLIARLWTVKTTQERYVVAAMAAIVVLVILFIGREQGLKLYPVVINFSLLTVFGLSLFSAMPVVERLARIREPDLPPQAVDYTRRVTQAWSIFFAVNALVSLASVLSGSDVFWFWYNGVIAYILIAMMMAGEWLIRQRVRAR